jgi:hypothetical protein
LAIEYGLAKGKWEPDRNINYIAKLSLEVTLICTSNILRNRLTSTTATFGLVPTQILRGFDGTTGAG